MVLRIVFLTGFVLLVIAFERNSTTKTPIVPLSAVLCAAYMLALAGAILLRINANLMKVAWFQVIGDLFVVGGIIFATGGIESPLSFLFLFVIISASVMLQRGASYLAASGASIIYGLLVDLEYFNLIQPVYFFPKSTVSYQGAYGFYIIALNIASFFSVAYLSGILSHRMRIIKDELRNKSIDFKKLQEFHRNVVQNMVNGLMTTDLEGRVTSVNIACESITGYPLEECIGRYCYQLLPVEELSRLFIYRKGEIPAPYQLEGECLRRDGAAILVSMKISHLTNPENLDPGSPKALEGYICVFEDRTEMHRLEEKMKQSEQLAAVGKFSAGLAHEIRNPLASLSGSIQVLKETLATDDQQKRLMDIVLKETERVNAIVSDFLSYSQPRKSKTTVIDLTQLLQDIVILMKNSNEYDPTINIKLNVPQDHIIIQSEEAQIKQMIWNLAINGIQAMDKSGNLTMTLKKVDGYKHKDFETSRRGVLLIVEDQGRGISREQMESIFDPFFTTRDEGVGLGLPTVKQIVERFAGHIGVESEPGRGTCFDVFLPQERALLSHRNPETKESSPQSLSTEK
ncbi:MAG: PAS domain S-box protein [Nitrospinaceae bacterium]|nr:PAS domain S-box protein [Nitrospinaceae bacterium]NIT83625.1 PAS domain S-box protein [Nitrospinaceae bacterium]